MNSVRQTETPLNRLYFSQFNVDLLQRGIRQDFLNKTGLAIDYQKEADLRAIMRVVFINNSGDHFSNVNRQVKAMNTKVISTAAAQIRTGVAQYISYREEIDAPFEPIPHWENTTTTGKKIPKSDLIGL